MRSCHILQLAILSLTVSCHPIGHGKRQKPNVIFIMMDDLGFSQIAYISENISEKDYDPLFLEFTLDNTDIPPEEALALSRQASPTLSRMAREGAMFTNAFAPSNLCAPSRIGIATGIHPNHMGMYRNVDVEATGPPPGSLLAGKLKEKGYATAHIGKWHLGRRDEGMVQRYMEKHGIEPPPGSAPVLRDYPDIRRELDENGYMGSTMPEYHALNNGFDYYFGYNMWESPFYNATNVWEGFKHAGTITAYNTDVFTEKAIEFIEKSIREGKPFYVQLHYHAVHAPLQPKAPDAYYDRFGSASYNLNNFYAHVFGVDENVRRLESLLKEKGMSENTLFVFTSDNGGSIDGICTLPGNAPYRGHKGMYLLGGIKVPLFFYWPAGIKNPANKEQLVSTLDILPTIIDAAGIEVPDSIDGKSLLPALLKDSNKPVHEYLLWSGIHARAWGFNRITLLNPPLVSREMAPYAWVVIKDNHVLRFTGKTREGLYKDIPEGKPGILELYNMATDPGEKNNLLQQDANTFHELKTIWEEEAAGLPPPIATGRDKWEELVAGNNPFPTGN